ncbi:rRNA processing/ribosome biogenesis-domain-containing protein [Rhodofomes roseus]|uniref:Pre-rRNA-processing protein RIX1 n=1 Tax=Rhodofomes roseus TaxID=34475 RepID=A0ABQ8KYJ0_9APHY|nr:rRNA processing/ribosome biogenesis-domain-containing protein [Rhodofomes roseus]KAH9844088.1 rRNA processing/ribosome biogenesis-domain-containing protein [Rhodofomes roseus]
MESVHPLKGLLQLQLASDASAVLHLPYVLETISAQHFVPSPHTQKWCTRVNSLIHSRDPGARWSGLCLALQTSIHSRSLMMEYATSWIGVALPLLSKDEPVTSLKAAIRLLRRIFSSAMDVAEFQRQICLPNVPKFSAALIPLADKHTDADIKLLALNTLTHLVPLFPTLHRSLHLSLSSAALNYLNGSTPRPTPAPLTTAASQLYSILHVTGGKVGAANVWRKSLDDTLGFAWNALACMRKTFQPAAHGQTAPPLSSEDPVVAIPLNLDRLRAAVRIMCDILHAPTSRPVAVPVGPLVKLCLAMLRCTPEQKGAEGHIDLSTRAMELAVIPSIWTLACELLQSVAESVHRHLLPYLPQLASHLAFHLEQQRTPSERLSFLKATHALLTACPHLHDTITSSRLARAVAPAPSVLLSTKSQGQQDAGVGASKSKNRKGKKRARGYEGDEVFNVAADVVCTSETDGNVLLTSIDVIRLVLRNSQLPPAVHSLLSRVLLAVYVSLPQMQPALVSADLSLHGKVHEKVRAVCIEQASGTSNVLSKSLGLVVSGMSPGQHDTVNIMRDVDLLLHPRVPPLVRSLPHVEMLSLFREEEGDEEAEMRKAMGLATAEETLSTLPSTTQNFATPPGPARFTQMVPETSTAHNTASSSQQQTDTLHAQGLPVPSHPTLPTETSTTSAPFTPVIQPSTASVPSEVRPQMQGSAPMDEDDEDEPMPTINMDSDSDADS